jgi:diguanylate cyclase (GGDEF)-like protein
MPNREIVNQRLLDQPKPPSPWLIPGFTVVLYYTSKINYLLFHTLVEGFAIVVASLIYVLATRTYRHSQNNIFLLLGIAYINVAALDFFHTLTYKGMGVFPNFNSDIPTQLWIAGRFLEAVSFMFMLFFRQRRFNRRFISMAYAFVTACLLLSVMVFRVFPTCFIEGKGLTTFKVLSEYVIVCILLGSAYVLHLQKDQIELVIYKSVWVAMIITAASELSFTLYTDVYGIANMVGHLLKVVSYCFVYSGVVTQGIDAPYGLMAAELKDRAIKDQLTGLHNRQGMVELMKKELRQVKEGKSSLGILMMDLDKFKFINDSYGHLFGDEVLKQFANLLVESIRENDVACRLGGDEFTVLLRNVDLSKLDQVKQRIQVAATAWIRGDKKLQGLGVSIGTSLSQPGQTSDIDQLLKKADKAMYAVKQAKKERARQEE